MSSGLVAVLKGRQTAVVAGLVGFGALLVVRARPYRFLQALARASISSPVPARFGSTCGPSGAHMVFDHPIRGIGLDNFLYYYQHGYGLPSAWQDPNLSPSSQYFAQLVVEPWNRGATRYSAPGW